MEHKNNNHSWTDDRMRRIDWMGFLSKQGIKYQTYLPEAFYAKVEKAPGCSHPWCWFIWSFVEKEGGMPIPLCKEAKDWAIANGVDFHELEEPDTVKVVFRKFPNGDAIAFFPEVLATMDPNMCMSYMRVGQHGAADVSLIKELKRASFAEVDSLHKELTGIYNDCFLEVVFDVTEEMHDKRRHSIKALPKV